VLDDHADTRLWVARVLEERGAVVHCAASTAEAWGLLHARGFRPDVLVSDLAMPGEDGCSFLRRLRAEEKARGGGEFLPALALTAYTREADREGVLVAGFQAHVSKPVSPEDLVLMVARVTAMGRNRVAHRR
jgi:CheY-like chemotaxis protein